MISLGIVNGKVALPKQGKEQGESVNYVKALLEYQIERSEIHSNSIASTTQVYVHLCGSIHDSIIPSYISDYADHS